MTTPESQSARSVSSDVTVGVDPDTAFAVFTDEIDLWWVRGPINFYDAARAIGMRCEPGVGGRLLELYSEDDGDALELGRITIWRPGVLLAWESSVDDVQTQVRFEQTASGTKVTVTATIPAGGLDKGGTSWVRVHGRGWFRTWCARRDTALRVPVETGRLGVAVYYPRPVTAARWLAEAFGLGSPDDFTGDDDKQQWIEFKVGNCSVMLFRREADSELEAAITHVPWVYVDDLDAHVDHARRHGATIVSEIHQYGYRSYEAADPAGYRWTFVQARPGM